MNGTPVERLADLRVGRDRRIQFHADAPDPDKWRASIGEHERDGGMVVGVAEADITPPPGLPKAGYSSNAHDGNGFRSRLRARVTYARTADAAIAIVQCDLLGGSSVVQRLVAQRCDDFVPFAGVMIGATHTHAGPGQFLGTDFYNRFASNRSGFDVHWADFLVDSIAGAVRAAAETARPGLLTVGTTPVWGLTRNRSLVPHVQNETVEDQRTDPQRKFVAVNPSLHLIRADVFDDDTNGGHTRPIGAALFFSVHGTGVSMRNHEYNADLWAYLVDATRHGIERHYDRPVQVGAAECTHADIAPAIRPKQAGHLESRRIGSAVGRQAAELFVTLEPGGAADASPVPGLGVALREINLDRSHTIGDIELPEFPAVGAALVAGAQENFTPVINRIPPFRPGTPKRNSAHLPHGEKWILGSRSGQSLLVPPRSFPRIIPIQVLRIGGSAICAIPFEVTIEAGRRFAQAAEASAADQWPAERVIVSSVANEYCGYVTTPEEYTQQFYEGGHTLYGANTQPFLEAHLAELAGSLDRPGVCSQVETVRTFDLAVRRYLQAPLPTGTPTTWLDRAGDNTQNNGAGHEVVTLDALDPAVYHEATPGEDGFWETRWEGPPTSELAWNRRLISVQRRSVDRVTGSEPAFGEWTAAMRHDVPVSDAYPSIEVTWLGAKGGRHRYRARWYDPEIRPDLQHRFVWHHTDGTPRATTVPFD